MLYEHQPAGAVVSNHPGVCNMLATPHLSPSCFHRRAAMLDTNNAALGKPPTCSSAKAAQQHLQPCACQALRHGIAGRAGVQYQPPHAVRVLAQQVGLRQTGAACRCKAPR